MFASLKGKYDMKDYIISCCSTADLTEEHFKDRDIECVFFHYELEWKRIFR